MRQIEGVVRNRDTHMAFRDQYMRSLFAPDTPEAVIDAAMTVEMRTPAEVGMALWAPLFEFTAAELKRRSGELIGALGFLPALSIDREEQPEYYRELEAAAPSVHVEVVRGGHWLQLEHPARLAVLIREFLERYGLSSGQT
jgi:pimeloyl-ACP methyl ester carboxylesterase